MNELPQQYLTKRQAVQKYAFLTENMLKNLLFKNPGGFRSKVVRKLGRRIVLDENALLHFISESREKEKQPSCDNLYGNEKEWIELRDFLFERAWVAHVAAGACDAGAASSRNHSCCDRRHAANSTMPHSRHPSNAAASGYEP